MKDNTDIAATTANASNGASKPQASCFHPRNRHLASNGNPHPMRISRVPKTGQSAAIRESHLEDTSEIGCPDLGTRELTFTD
jgi:hypothetical protein